MAKRSKDLSLKIPDKEPGEEPATEKQVAYIRHLADHIDLPHDLGKWQASSLIEQLKHAKEEYQKDLDRGVGGTGCLLFMIVGTVVILLAAAKAMLG